MATVFITTVILGLTLVNCFVMKNDGDSFLNENRDDQKPNNIKENGNIDFSGKPVYSEGSWQKNMRVFRQGFADEKKWLHEHTKVMEENLDHDLGVGQTILETEISEVKENISATSKHIEQSEEQLLNMTIMLSEKIHKLEANFTNLKAELRDTKKKLDNQIVDGQAAQQSVTEMNTKLEALVDKIYDTQNKTQLKDFALTYISNKYHYRNSLYYFSKEEVTWESAKILCEALGASLIEINNQEEYWYVTQHITQFAPYRDRYPYTYMYYGYYVDLPYDTENYRVWLGGTYLEPEEDWVWLSNNASFANDSFVDWAPGNPSNVTGSHWYNKQCPILQGALWYTQRCRHRFGYICEKDISLKLCQLLGRHHRYLCYIYPSWFWV